MSEHDPHHHHDDTPDWVTMEPRRASSDAAWNEHSASAGEPGWASPPAAAQPRAEQEFTIPLARVGEEIVAWFKTLTSAAVYATLIVTFGFQVARVEGQSMAPTLEDQDRLIVNKLAYRLHDPQVGDIVMLYYPVDPDKSFVKRIVGEPNDTLRSENGRVFRNEIPIPDDFVAPENKDTLTWGPRVIAGWLLLRDGRSPEQQFGQPQLGFRAEEIHHRQGPDPLVAGQSCTALRAVEVSRSHLFFQCSWGPTPTRSRSGVRGLTILARGRRRRTLSRSLPCKLSPQPAF